MVKEEGAQADWAAVPALLLVQLLLCTCSAAWLHNLQPIRAGLVARAHLRAALLLHHMSILTLGL